MCYFILFYLGEQYLQTKISHSKTLLKLLFMYKKKTVGPFHQIDTKINLKSITNIKV